MVAARCLSLVFLTVLCGVQDTGCEGKSGTTTNLVPEGCGDASATSTSTPATSTAPPKDYALYLERPCLYKVLKHAHSLYPTSCKMLCRRRRYPRRYVLRNLPDFTTCLKLASRFAERTLNPKQCEVGLCFHGVCRLGSRRVSCSVPSNKTARSSKLAE
ncbi:uncharacterized protein LOC142590277 isoform X1 [Dermacentor variabilis]|uniref:uncharacterized protein LOC142590277 isoform X1 n=1 Tax=Dermacentor variabilis TaxID=34621 RepID=UPI003F5BD8BC